MGNGPVDWIKNKLGFGARDSGDLERRFNDARNECERALFCDKDGFNSAWEYLCEKIDERIKKISKDTDTNPERSLGMMNSLIWVKELPATTLSDAKKLLIAINEELEYTKTSESLKSET